MTSVLNPFDAGYYNSDELQKFGFKSVGNNVLVAKDCSIIGLHNICIGNNVRIDSHTTIVAPNGYLNIGSYIHIGGKSYIGASGGITLEDFVGLSGGVSLYSASDDYSGRALTNPTVPSEFTNVKRAEIILSRHVIIGAGSIVLPGCKVGVGSAIGALSLVNKNLDSWGIYTGNPCKRLMDRKQGLLEKEALLIGSNITG